jgi:type I restriction enzyme S subunit
MNELQTAPIKNFALGIYDGPHATPREADEGPIFLGIKNVTPEGRLDLSEIRHVSEQEYPKWTRRVTPQKDDVVFSYEATLHRYALIPEDFHGCLGRRMALVRPDRNKIIPRFLHYYFMSPAWKAVIEGNIINGATVDRIPIKKFPDFEVSIPSISKQRSISDVLSAYDDMIENNRRRIQLLEQAARLLYKEWFVRFRFPGHGHSKIINVIPTGWEKKTAIEVMDVLSGGTPKTTNPAYWDGDIPFYTPKDSLDYAYVFETEKSITEEGLKNCNSKLYDKDTVFITARGTVGKISLAQRPMAMNQSCYALIARPPLNQYFMYFALVESIEQFRSRAVGAVFDAIIVDTFKMIPFVVPDKKLIDLFTKNISPILSQIDILSGQNRLLTQARDIILPRLMNGEIAV